MVRPEEIRIQDFSYTLPQDRIADYPLEQRDRSRLLVYSDGKITDDHFQHLADHLPYGASLVVNDTRVIEARLHFTKETGGVIEIFCLEPEGMAVEEAMRRRSPLRWKCLIGGASKWKPGQVLRKKFRAPAHQQAELSAYFRGKEEDSFIIEFEWPGEEIFGEVLHATGAIPLPPYIHREPEELDSERYQTIFSRHDGSVAAPTASLHFTPAVFENLGAKNIAIIPVTLHVGAGTFKPVKAENIAAHRMHGEPCHISLDSLKKLVEADTLIASGTTSLRTLESLHWMGMKLNDNSSHTELEQWEAYRLAEKFPDRHYRESYANIIRMLEQKGMDHFHFRTELIIVPGYPFQTAKALITNFHQPQSTLLLLVAAFAGSGWKEIYEHALAGDYRFLSYGDSSLIWRKISG